MQSSWNYFRISRRWLRIDFTNADATLTSNSACYSTAEVSLANMTEVFARLRVESFAAN